MSMLAAATLALSACDPGSVGDGTGPGPNVDGTTNALCEATLLMSGTFAPNGPGVDADGACIPLGTWTVNVAVENMGTCESVPTIGQYVYDVIEDEGGYVATFRADPTSERIFTNISIEGECQGHFEHYSADGKQYTMLKPYTNADFTLGGIGSFEVYAEDQLNI